MRSERPRRRPPAHGGPNAGCMAPPPPGDEEEPPAALEAIALPAEIEHRGHRRLRIAELAPKHFGLVPAEADRLRVIGGHAPHNLPELPRLLVKRRHQGAAAGDPLPVERHLLGAPHGLPFAPRPEALS